MSVDSMIWGRYFGTVETRGDILGIVLLSKSLQWITFFLPRLQLAHAWVALRGLSSPRWLTQSRLLGCFPKNWVASYDIFMKRIAGFQQRLTFFQMPGLFLVYKFRLIQWFLNWNERWHIFTRTRQHESIFIKNDALGRYFHKFPQWEFDKFPWFCAK